MTAVTDRTSAAPSLRRTLEASWLRIGMVLAIAGVVGAAAWSAASERDAAIAELSNEQTVIATVVGIDFENRLSVYLADPRTDKRDEVAFTDDVILELLAGVHRLEDQGEVMVLVARPGDHGFLTTDRRVISSRHLRDALDARERAIVIPRDEAVTYGLPRRRAVAGLARVGTHERGPWGVVVLASANRVRLRELHEQWRLGLTAGVVTVLVLALGGAAQRRERRRLELEREIAISGLEREREAALAKADKMAALAALSTGIAHELGTPLSIIVERLDQLESRLAGDERAIALLKIVAEQAERIQRIARASLALARGDSPFLVETEPPLLARRAADLVRHRFSKAGVSLECSIEEGLPRIACEPSLFEQALVNLLLNACEASPKSGRVVLNVRAAPGEVHFIVDDEGEGIPKDALEKATEPFFSTKRKQGGSGLGLTIAREIVAHHAGTLLLAQRPEGIGTRAAIALKT